LLGDRKVLEARKSTSKVLYRVAITIGLIVVGIGGVVVLGLLQNYGIISLSSSLTWLTSAINTIGNTQHFWSLWCITGGCFLVGGSLIGFGSYKIQYIDKKLKDDKSEFVKQPAKKLDATNEILQNEAINPQVEILLEYLFVKLINRDNLDSVQPLGKLLNQINEFLNSFNKMHSIFLKAIGSRHSSDPSDPWQTIKIIDNGIFSKGATSPFLAELNDVLHQRFGIVSNGGDEGPNRIGQKKRTPVCFQQKNGNYMHPQLQISHIDIRRILEVITKEEYINELKNAWGSSS
jgi:hypothetical protein